MFLEMFLIPFTLGLAYCGWRVVAHASHLYLGMGERGVKAGMSIKEVQADEGMQYLASLLTLGYYTMFLAAASLLIAVAVAWKAYPW